MPPQGILAILVGLEDGWPSALRQYLETTSVVLVRGDK